MTIKNNNKFLYIPRNREVKIRYVGNQAELYHYFRVASLFEPMISARPYPARQLSKMSFFREDNKEESGFSISKRVVSLVVDREDEKIKAFACPISAWNLMVKEDKENDFIIRRTGEGLSTRYSVIPSGISTISKYQEKIVEATLNSFSLADIFIKEEWELLENIIERIDDRWSILDL